MSGYSNHRPPALASLVIAVLLSASAFADPPERVVSAADGLAVSVKEIGPVTEVADLQIICVLKHDPAGDKYAEAMRDLNDKLGGLISALRDRGDFVGDAGETLLLTPPTGSIGAHRLLLIGVGTEADLSAERLATTGRIAAREANRLQATTVGFAPALRDQGSQRVDVADGDAAFAEQFLLALDTQTRLAAQKLSDPVKVKSLTIEAGPKFFDNAAEKVTSAVDAADTSIQKRTADPYIRSER
jgi:hypothetical protein